MTPLLNSRPAEVAWLVALALLVVYETVALSTGRMTLSRFVWTVQRGQYGPLVPFLAGMLCGHFFWSGN
jgi:hypothetical protein